MHNTNWMHCFSFLAKNVFYIREMTCKYFMHSTDYPLEVLEAHFFSLLLRKDLYIVWAL